MSEPLREMISAVVDGEASEFEYRKVFESLEDGDVRALLSRHYTLRTVMRRDADRLCPDTVSAGIFAALAAEMTVSIAPVRRWRQPLGGLAVAASVCLVAVLGSQAMIQQDTAGLDAGQSQRLASSGAVSVGPLGRSAYTVAAPLMAAPGVGMASAVPVAAGASGDLGADANRMAQQRLQLYMLQHAQNAALNTNQGMLPYARVVNYQEP